MCTSKIKSSFRIPFHLDEPDLNGNIYTRGVTQTMVDTFEGPLPLTNSVGDNSLIIGEVTKVTSEFDEENNVEYLVCECVINVGGTRETVEGTRKDGKFVITDAILSGIGFQSYGMRGIIN